MKCVICKTGEVGPAKVQAEIVVGPDRLLVTVQAEACRECGEPYYSAEALRHLERVREDFARRAIAPTSCIPPPASRSGRACRRPDRGHRGRPAR